MKARPPPGAPRIAYLVNQYPKVSHSFIRREILALESLGHPVMRIGVRGWDERVADSADEAERDRTRYLLKGGLLPLLGASLRLAVLRPVRLVRALGLALQMSRRSERTVLHHLVYLAEACQLVRWLEKEGIEHLHAHFGTNPADVALLARLLGGPPYSFTVHGPEEFDKPVALGLAAKGRLAAFVVAISSYGRSQLYRWLPQSDWERVRVVHCGLESAFHAGAAVPAPAAPRLVCVGRLCEQKGQLLLVEAAARVVAEGLPLELVLAGDGEMRPEIEALIARLRLQSHVRITGWIGAAQVRDEILAARALVLPSFAEGLPVVLMESLALRRPVISTFVAGIPELVEDERNGWLVPAGDVESLVVAIKRCLSASPERLSEMGDAGRLRVLERHDSVREAGKLAKLFAQTGGSSATAVGAPVSEGATP